MEMFICLVHFLKAFIQYSELDEDDGDPDTYWGGLEGQKTGVNTTYDPGGGCKRKW